MNMTLLASIRGALRRSVWASALTASVLVVSSPALQAENAAEAAADVVRQAAMRTTSAQLYASPAQVRMVQEKLKNQANSSSAIDGVWGDATRDAVRDYQRANGLAPTGQLDTSLLSALQIGNVLEGQAPSSTFLDGLLRGDSERKDVDPNAGGAPIFVSPEHVAQIQYLLRDQGFYDGEVDGAWGDATARAANKYRQAQGLEAYDGVDIALLRSLNAQGKALPKLASRVAARTEGVPLAAGPTAVRALQRELSRAGANVGDVDGVWGENTRQALRDFQRSHDLEPTGTLTLPTLSALGLDVANKPHKSDIDSHAQRERERLREAERDALATSGSTPDD